MNEQVYEDVKDVVDFVEQFYTLEVDELTKKLENIKRININSLTDLIKNEISKDNIQSKKDILKYVKSIIQD